MRISIIFVCLSSVIISGCKKNDLIVNPLVDVKGIIPLSVGAQWNYNVYAIDTMNVLQLVNTLSYKIISDSIINNIRWYKFSKINRYSWENPSEFLCTNTQVGLISRISSGSQLVFKYPAAVQDSFYVNEVVNYLHVISIDTLITIPVGTFHCYAFENNQPVFYSAYGGSREILYLSPDAGLVKVEAYASPQVGIKMYLWSYGELSSVSQN
jgi:hypothetical protein